MLRPWQVARIVQSTVAEHRFLRIPLTSSFACLAGASAIPNFPRLATSDVGPADQRVSWSFAKCIVAYKCHVFLFLDFAILGMYA